MAYPEAIFTIHGHSIGIAFGFIIQLHKYPLVTDITLSIQIESIVGTPGCIRNDRFFL
jgi:hypothetical protein